MEIYLNVKPSIFSEVVGFGPVSDQRFAEALGFMSNLVEFPPLVVQLTDGKVFVCEFNQGEHVDNPEAVSFNRNFISTTDFLVVNMDYYMKSLISEAKSINFNLGDSWENERFYTWKVESKDYLSKLPEAFLESAISLGDGYKIARRFELIYEWEFFKEISKATEQKAKHEEWLAGRKEVFEDLKNSIPWLVSYEVNKGLNTGISSKKPGLDFYDKK